MASLLYWTRAFLSDGLFAVVEEAIARLRRVTRGSCQISSSSSSLDRAVLLNTSMGASSKTITRRSRPSLSGPRRSWNPVQSPPPGIHDEGDSHRICRQEKRRDQTKFPDPSRNSYHGLTVQKTLYESQRQATCLIAHYPFKQAGNLYPWYRFRFYAKILLDIRSGIWVRPKTINNFIS